MKTFVLSALIGLMGLPVFATESPDVSSAAPAQIADTSTDTSIGTNSHYYDGRRGRMVCYAQDRRHRYFYGVSRGRYGQSARSEASVQAFRNCRNYSFVGRCRMAGCYWDRGGHGWWNDGDHDYDNDWDDDDHDYDNDDDWGDIWGRNRGS